MKVKLFILLSLCIESLFAQSNTPILANSKWVFKSNKSIPTFLEAKVPGNVHTDLFRLSKIPNPHVGTNEKALQWIAEEDWTYQTTFEIDAKQLAENNFKLAIESIDTHAKLFINNQLIGSSQNQFVPINLEVKSFLKVGLNELRIEFESSTKIAQQGARSLPYVLPGEDRVFVRKAQYQFGWDWSPKMVSYGIGKISLNTWKNSEILHSTYQQKLNKDSSIDLTFTLEIASDIEQKITLKTALKDLESKVTKKNIKLKKGINTIQQVYTIKNPIWWWSNGLGKAHLYTFLFELVQQKETINQYQQKIGIRTIEWVQDKDSIGQSFYMKLNGKPIFLKGANYIPPHHFLNDLNPQVYTDLIVSAVEANMNMLRVWGGGVYAPNTFYETCDSLGILVWQDFMFACAMYPSDSSFLNNVSQEIVAQVKRLQNHASLAIWCGNNENAEGWHNWGWQKQYAYSVSDSANIARSYFMLFDSLIPQTLKTYHPNSFYWPSSPSFGWGKVQSLTQGDLHYWGVWWGLEPFENYAKKVGRFVSEFGFQALPNKHSLAAMQVLKEGNIDSTMLRAHQKHPTGFETITSYMQRDYPLAKNPEEYIYLSQLVQAKGIKMAVESYRAAKPYCMGSLYWQLNDCWPSISWSSIDFYQRKKALHYQLKNSYAPQLLVVNFVNDSIEVQLISDALNASSGTLQLMLWSTNGQILDQQLLGVNIPANSNTKYRFALNPNLNWQERNQWVLQANLLEQYDIIATQSFLFVSPKDLQLPEPKIEIEILPNNQISLLSQHFVKDVFIHFNNPAIEVSHNYFDLLPYQKVFFQVKNKENTSEIIKELDIKIQSLNLLKK